MKESPHKDGDTSTCVLCSGSSGRQDELSPDPPVKTQLLLLPSTYVCLKKRVRIRLCGNYRCVFAGVCFQSRASSGVLVSLSDCLRLPVSIVD